MQKKKNTTMSILLAALLPSLLLIAYICYKDRLQMEPPRMLLKGFGLGVLSVIPALILEMAFDDYFQGSATMLALSPAIFEEGSKLLMIWLLLRNNKYYDEYLDGIVYAVCVGVGFECTENIFYFIEDPSCMTMRILMPGHFAYAIIMGYYLGLAHFSKGAERSKNLCLAVVLPMAAHWFWDFCCFASEEEPIMMLYFFVLLIALVIAAKRSIAKLQIRDAERRAQEAAEAARRAWEEQQYIYGDATNAEDSNFREEPSTTEEHKQAFEDIRFR